jgi:hypothetical protein
MTTVLKKAGLTGRKRTVSGAVGIVAVGTGLVLLLIGLFLDWGAVLTRLGFPAHELANAWVRADLRVVRLVCCLVGGLLAFSGIVLWRFPRAVAGFASRLERSAGINRVHPSFVPLVLTAIVLAQTVLQLVLYLFGYYAFSADDFGRPLSAVHWLRHPTIDLGMDGPLGLAGSGWLSFSDYLIGGALAIHPDLYVTPRIVNLILSSVAVISVYLLGRELFGRAVGLVAAFLLAFQPWIVWLGISGLSAELPSLVMLPLFGTYLVRWLRTDRPSALLAASAFLAIADGFRYENWLFSAVTSVLILYLIVSRWRRGGLTRQWLAAAACALVVLNGLPVGWMAASYVLYGDWLPAMHGINAFMVAGLTSQTTRTETQMSIPLMVAGSFPFEIGLALAGIALFPGSWKSRPVRLYLAVLVGTALVFAVVFRGVLPAWLVVARYLLGFVALALPCAGLLLTQLLRARGPWRNEGLLAACLILLTVTTFDVGRALNYPTGYPRDAILTGWGLRHLQEAGTIPETARILIERTEDFGDLSIVALANRPERFVILNELAYRKMALSGLLANRPALAPGLEGEGVRGTVCGTDLQQPACRDSIRREQFDLVILSTPERVTSFAATFRCRSWNIGRYHVFDLKSAAARHDLD